LSSFIPPPQREAGNPDPQLTPRRHFSARGKKDQAAMWLVGLFSHAEKYRENNQKKQAVPAMRGSVQLLECQNQQLAAKIEKTCG
jgi:hypothetical protein